LRATAGISVYTLALPEFLQDSLDHHGEQHTTTTIMLFQSLAVLAAASSFFSLTAAHNIQMKAHQRECFHESLHKDDKMTVTFQVGDREFGGSGNLEIDFWVRRSPSRPRSKGVASDTNCHTRRSKPQATPIRFTSAA
jgi:hypothetical protein